jgi:hypothetical protein
MAYMAADSFKRLGNPRENREESRRPLPDYRTAFSAIYVSFAPARMLEPTTRPSIGVWLCVCHLGSTMTVNPSCINIGVAGFAAAMDYFYFAMD